MGYAGDRVAAEAAAIIDSTINIRRGDRVPETSEVLLEKNQGVEVDAVYLYADMVGSSKLAQMAYKPVTAKIIRSYINSASKILRAHRGEIRSFDGDRVMAIFMGPNRQTDAVRAALATNWLVHKELGPKISAKWADIAKSWTLAHSIGIDSGEAVITRGGVRGDNDLISIGKAPNVAAKLSDVRNRWQLHITEAVYEPMSEAVALSEDGQNMWDWEPAISVGDRSVRVIGSHWMWQM